MDASFLYSETPQASMAGAGVYIYDPSTAPGGKVTFKGILAHLESRLPAARVFRQRLVRVPLDLDHPYWVEDPAFDLEFHVRHISLPKPGDWRQLCIQVARLISRPLDLERPLWELYVIEGLDNVDRVPKGSFALVNKVHHAAIDGMSGVELNNAIHDLSPDAERTVLDDPWRPEQIPSTPELLGRAALNNAARPMHFARVMGRTMPQLGRLQDQIRRQNITPPTTTIPRTRWSGPVSAHRVFDGVRFDLDAMKSIKRSVEGATVNDVVLTVVGGALRNYLSDKNELPSDPLIAMAPISVRSADERSAAGNLVSGMFVTLGTDIADPRARLEAVRASTHSQKEFMNAVGARTLVDFAELMPGGLVGLGTRTAARMSLANRLRPVFNATVTNMPGPQHPLYMAGAQCVAQYGVGMIVDGMGLIHPVVSYCGEITVSFTSDREMMPDPAFYAESLEQSFDDLEAAVRTTKTPRKAPARRSGTGRSKAAAKGRATTRKRPAKAATATTRKRPAKAATA
jgi:WS/DGAT/MGAT family acyltransferase